MLVRMNIVNALFVVAVVGIVLHAFAVTEAQPTAQGGAVAQTDVTQKDGDSGSSKDPQVPNPGAPPDFPSLGQHQDANPRKNSLTTCRDLCGDGKCQEMVCMAVGCPCAESVESCAADCRGF